MSETVRLSTSEGVATVTLDRPERLNAITEQLLEELLATLEAVAGDESTRVVVLTGSGRAFCVGGDLREGVGAGVGGDGPLYTAVGNLRRYMRTAELLHEMPKPTMAAINGACAGAGLSLACACDLRYASDSAIFTTAFLNVGLSGDFGGTWSLTRIVGTARARAAYMLAERFDADEAQRIGLVSDVLGDDELGDHVRGVAERLATQPQQALRSMKANLNDALELSFGEALDHEAIRHIGSGRTDDAREATAAFLEKRAPVFRGS